MTYEESMISALDDVAKYFRRLCHEEADLETYAKYYSMMSVVSQASNLIEELMETQEPRVLTLEEVESSEDSVWLDKDIPGFEPIPVLVDKVGKYIDTFISSGGLRFQGEKSKGQVYGDYGKTWRCWSAHPTDEQRESVPWES